MDDLLLKSTERLARACSRRKFLSFTGKLALALGLSAAGAEVAQASVCHLAAVAAKTGNAVRQHLTAQAVPPVVVVPPALAERMLGIAVPIIVSGSVLNAVFLARRAVALPIFNQVVVAGLAGYLLHYDAG